MGNFTKEMTYGHSGFTNLFASEHVTTFFDAGGCLACVVDTNTRKMNQVSRLTDQIRDYYIVLYYSIDTWQYHIENSLPLQSLSILGFNLNNDSAVDGLC